MKKIGLHGSYFGRNFGDTLILYIIKNWIEEFSDEIKVSLPFVQSEKEAYEILNKENFQFQIENLDGLIFGPGGYFGERPGSFFKKLKWSIRNYKRHIIWNRKLYKNKIPYILVGVGVGPISFTFLKKGVIKLFKNAEYISVRDKYSKQYLIDWGIDPKKINLAPDVALTLKPLNKNYNGVTKVALHYANDNLMKHGKVNEFIEFIKQIKSKNEIYLLEDSENQYLDNNENNIKTILKNNGIEIPIIPYKGPSQLIQNINLMDMIITNKLHVGIVGYALGKKLLSIPNHSKTIRFYEQIEKEEFCIPLSEINSNLLCEKFKKLDSEMKSENILYNDALKNKEIVFDFLNSL